MLEFSSQQTRTAVLDVYCSSDATHISGHATGESFRQPGFEGDVAYGKAASRLENAGNLPEHGRLVRREVDNAVRDDEIDGRIRQRNAVDGRYGFSQRLS